MRSRLEPFKKFVRMLRGHSAMPGILSSTKARVSNGAVEGGNKCAISVHEPSCIRIPNRRELHCGDLSLLRPATAARATYIALLGQEP